MASRDVIELPLSTIQHSCSSFSRASSQPACVLRFLQIAVRLEGRTPPLVDPLVQQTRRRSNTCSADMARLNILFAAVLAVALAASVAQVSKFDARATAGCADLADA